jgi:sulfide:quinone oxidoreductase
VEVDTNRLEGDALVVALGASRHPRAVPGFTEHAMDYYDPNVAWNGTESIRRFKGGRLVIGIFGAPYPCPPAPYELALLLAERFEREKIPGEILLFTPQPDSLPILGAGARAFDERLARAGITFMPRTQATAVEPGAVIAGGHRIPFDLLIGVAPHRLPPVVAQAGLTHGKPWVHADRETLETGVPNVWAVGDCVSIPLSNGMWLPKTGVFANAQGEVVAARIADRLAGREPDAVFTGEGTCFVQTGQGRAAAISGNFFAVPPEVTMGDETEAAYASKVAFESDLLGSWFGQ